eukprot:4397200-Prymnesium_polylepis.4
MGRSYVQRNANASSNLQQAIGARKYTFDAHVFNPPVCHLHNCWRRICRWLSPSRHAEGEDSCSFGR